MSTPVRFYRGAALKSGRLGIFPGAFNPVTRAHLAVPRAARDQYGLDQVTFLLPQTFPHKEYEETSLEERVAMLADGLDSEVEDDHAMAIASSKGGLFVEIAREFRGVCGDGVALFLICGRDAAERIVHWDYGDGLPFVRQLEEFQMLAATRGGGFSVPAECKGRVHPVRMPPDFSEISSSAVREAIRTGQGWDDLVPEAVARRIRETGLYGFGRNEDESQ